MIETRLIVTDRFSEHKQCDGFILLSLLHTNDSGSSDYYNNNVQTIRSDRFHRVRRTLVLQTTYLGRGGIREMSSLVIHLETLTLQTAVVHHFWRRVILYVHWVIFFPTLDGNMLQTSIWYYPYPVGTRFTMSHDTVERILILWRLPNNITILLLPIVVSSIVLLLVTIIRTYRYDSNNILEGYLFKRLT